MSTNHLVAVIKDIYKQDPELSLIKQTHRRNYEFVLQQRNNEAKADEIRKYCIALFDEHKFIRNRSKIIIKREKRVANQIKKDRKIKRTRKKLECTLNNTMCTSRRRRR